MGSRTRRHTTPRRSDTADPSWSRERALRVLFQADLRGVEPTVTLSRLDADEDARSLLDERDHLTEETPIVPPPGPDESGRAAEAASDSGGVAGGAATRGTSPEGAATMAAGTPDRPAGAQDRPAGAQDRPAGAPGRPRGVPSGWTDAPRSAAVPELDGFTRTLVRGVEEHREEVETLITRYSRRWAISRMPVVDRNVLRLATYELLHESTPPAVVIDEAVDLAKRLSTDDSGRFVNGVLESIRKDIADAQRGGVEPGA